MKNNDVWIDFIPTPFDVVSTKLRTWNLNHPGNLYYTDLVNKNAASLDKEDLVEIKRLAEQIVRCVVSERGGRFLKPRDGESQPTKCLVMDPKHAVTKVVHALRTAHSRLELRTTLGDSAPPKKQSTVRPPKTKSAADAKSNLQSPRQRSRRSTLSDSLVYQATAKTKKIPQHILNLITAVCNQCEAETAHRILDMPLHGQSLEGEPDKERRMRLQLRHRFASATAMGMSPLEFAARLLRLWEGKLIATKRRPKPKPSPGGGRNTPATPAPFIVPENSKVLATASPHRASSAEQVKSSHPVTPMVEASVLVGNLLPLSILQEGNTTSMCNPETSELGSERYSNESLHHGTELPIVVKIDGDLHV